MPTRGSSHLETRSRQLAATLPSTLPSLTRWRLRPDLFSEEVLGVKLWPAQVKVALRVASKLNRGDGGRIKVGTGHAVGKSRLAALLVIWLLVCWEHVTVITTAPTWRQVEGILWREIHSVIEAAPYELGGDLLKLRYTFGPDRFAFGQAVADPVKFQGWHNQLLVAIVDEAAGVPAGIFDAIEGTTTGDRDLILELGNPTDASSRFCDGLEKLVDRTRRREEAGTLDTKPAAEGYRISSWEAAEWNAKQPEEERIIGLASLAWCEAKRDPIDGWGEKSPAYQARVLGHVAHEDTSSLIALAWCEGAFRRYQEARWECEVSGFTLKDREADEVVIGLDVARHGGDRCAWCVRQDADLVYFETWENIDDDDALVQVAERTRDLCKEWGAQGVVLDATGMGWGVHDQLRRWKIACQAVQFGTKARNQKKFVDRRSELWWHLREWFVEGIGTLPEWDDVLRDVLLPRYKWVGSEGKDRERFALEKKDAMRRRMRRDAQRGEAIRSTDLGDAAALALETVASAQPIGVKRSHQAMANPRRKMHRTDGHHTEGFIGRWAA